MRKIILAVGIAWALLATPVFAQTMSGNGAGSGLSNTAPQTTGKAGESGVNTHGLNTLEGQKAQAIR
jgi:hypothetical protein